MTTISYFTQGATIINYASEVFSYISSNAPNQPNRTVIEDVSEKLGISRAAIAGAMAEENNDYLGKKSLNDAADWWALHNITITDIESFSDSDLIALVTVPVNVIDTRSHNEWANNYAAYLATGLDTTTLDIPGWKYFIKHHLPVLADLGPGNFRMATAISLLLEHPVEAEMLGLGFYRTDYAKLANDIINDTTGLTAKLYGLMIKEADTWYRDHRAYGDEWDSLPQEINDALYITYTNIGRENMQKGYDISTDKGHTPYEPIPAVSPGGGLDHLNNAAKIANAIHVADYGQVSFVPDAATWQQQARQRDNKGTAIREGLLNLRPFAIEDGNYTSGVLGSVLAL